MKKFPLEESRQLCGGNQFLEEGDTLPQETTENQITSWNRAKDTCEACLAELELDRLRDKKQKQKTQIYSVIWNNMFTYISSSQQITFLVPTRHCTNH